MSLYIPRVEEVVRAHDMMDFKLQRHRRVKLDSRQTRWWLCDACARLMPNSYNFFNLDVNCHVVVHFLLPFAVPVSYATWDSMNYRIFFTTCPSRAESEA